MSSQGQMSLGSQDSIRDFSRHQDDPENIMREPFRPTLPSARGSYASSSARTPDVELKMPRLDFEAESRRPARDAGESKLRRRAGPSSPSSGGSKRRSGRRRYDSEDEELPRRRTKNPIAATLPGALQDLLLWVLGIVVLAFRYAQKPLALLLAIYVSFGAIIMAQNMVTRSIYVSLSPICRLPGASMLNLPFCPSPPPPMTGVDNAEQSHFEFDDLMNVQGKLEQVLEKSVEGVSLPYEMKRSETTIRDLRTLIQSSDIKSRDELVHEFNSYIEVARQSASDLQRFNTHCGSAVDSVISINRWTSRYIDSLDPSTNDADSSIITRWSSWVFAPFWPTDRYFNEQMILDKYVEHTAQVSDRITSLILEAQALLGVLTRAEDHLSAIYDLSSRDSSDVAMRRDQVFWNLWTLVGANTARLHNLSQQLALLRRVDAQRNNAVTQVSALVTELESIQIGLEDLRDRVAAPELQRDMSAGIPLSVHIETIDRGVERLEEARSRISAAENDRVREALNKAGLKDEKLIE